MEILRGYSCDISIILLTLKECHTPSIEDNEVLVNFVTKVLLTAVKDESKVHSEMKTVLSQSYSSLKEILGKLSFQVLLTDADELFSCSTVYMLQDIIHPKIFY